MPGTTLASLWERRYDAIVVGPDAEWSRLKYSLSNGVKEELVERAADWPGIHAARQLVAGKPLEGYWWNRSKEWAARNRRQDYGTYDYATRYSIRFAQLPAFRHLSPEEYREKVGDLVREIEEEGERARGGQRGAGAPSGRPVAGVEKILSQNPLEPPTRVTKRSPKPLFHFASKEERDDLVAGFLAFQAQYQTASEALRGGNLKAAAWFPDGCYPPALPFVGPPPPKRLPWPPTRRITKLDSGDVERGVIPVIEVPAPVEARTRGQPP